MVSIDKSRSQREREEERAEDDPFSICADEMIEIIHSQAEAKCCYKSTNHAPPEISPKLPRQAFTPMLCDGDRDP